MFYSFIEAIGEFITSEWFILVLELIVILCETGMIKRLIRMPFKNRAKLVSIIVTTITLVVVLVEVLKEVDFSWKEFIYMCGREYINPIKIIIGLIVFDAIITVVILIIIACLGEFEDKISNFAKEFADACKSSKNNDETELEDCSTDESEEKEE